MPDDVIRFRSRLHAPTLGLLGLVVVACGLPSIYVFIRWGDLTYAVLAVYCFLTGAWILLAYSNRDRPVLEVGNAKVRCGSTFAVRRKSLPMDEIEAVDHRNGSLLLRMGKRVRVPLGEIPKEARGRAIETLKARAASPSPGSGIA